ncbi:hypothetical protein A3D80_01475 [Candidatus Roizmanbacteria bacterium RIFCSPHIGHO2_02_FULL_40_13b]|uniref:Nucleotidyl transferase AbiEii/AbiGii toxin family protein n=1 Tax=Candidatus Roizmanbacteria bacterium RIFCSPHIGHO2_01_FULL_39_24 TaxID=1802032 RepID=A0A1F7GIS8_9BACT|nr:MAG: hypothetical protein A2799_00750 [Candidatus Roizmanbacteria bacterium RIFCSPHIGHO2_01_FULL_39_24]OGK26125.1 MAG: hypothetical protein A3D80_01475 [Candidatus Roizmanbacteria bacterium RIFCSPHIGHO2_02_FULL_40_13b]OGK49476.1 MAG: hypothetical protein A3A56_00410 [Candidatus Roizmanbacteria bacterium RIFCSPLOWO2_01_FULL_40_32]OGK57236.1 MAG: hypothetical protein A3H83_03890 [Candidatus Roizmanbacteria bacterium RIFCSPLOWO2_02_FULL_39_8]
MAKTILTPFQKEVLDLISKNAHITQNFYLTGGTALAEFYLHHRLSEDLDLFSEQEFKLSHIQALVADISATLQLTKMDYRQQFGLYTFFLHRGTDMLKVDFNYYPFQPIGEKIFYNNALPIDSLHDIAVNKLQTIATQPRSRDFIDLYCILQQEKWTIETLRKEARNKFDWYVDEIQLGSRFLMVTELKDLPHILIPVKEKSWEDFWLEEAQKLKSDILE